MPSFTTELYVIFWNQFILQHFNENVVGKMAVIQLSATIWLGLASDSHWSVNSSCCGPGSTCGWLVTSTTTRQYFFGVVVCAIVFQLSGHGPFKIVRAIRSPSSGSSRNGCRVCRLLHIKTCKNTLQAKFAPWCARGQRELSPRKSFRALRFQELRPDKLSKKYMDSKSDSLMADNFRCPALSQAEQWCSNYLPV